MSFVSVGSGGCRIIRKNERSVAKRGEEGTLHATSDRFFLVTRVCWTRGMFFWISYIITFFLVVIPILSFFNVQSFFHTQQKRKLDVTTLSLFHTKPSKSHIFIISSFLLFKFILFHNSINLI